MEGNLIPLLCDGILCRQIAHTRIISIVDDRSPGELVDHIDAIDVPGSIQHGIDHFLFFARCRCQYRRSTSG